MVKIIIMCECYFYTLVKQENKGIALWVTTYNLAYESQNNILIWNCWVSYFIPAQKYKCSKNVFIN